MKQLLVPMHNRASRLSLRALICVFLFGAVDAHSRSEIVLPEQLPSGWAYEGCYQ